MPEYAPDVRQYPARPIVGVGALILDGDRLLLVERGKEPLTGYWSLPGGAVETGERLEEAMRREVQEETGLLVRVESIATVFERIMPDASGVCEYHYVLIDFICRVEGGVLTAGTDSRKAQWFRVSELGELKLTSGTKEVIDLCCHRTGPHPVVTRP